MTSTPPLNGYGMVLRSTPDYDHHVCPVPGCGRIVSSGQVACRECWCAVPYNRRRVLIEAFRLRESRPDVYDEACRIARALVIEVAEKRRTSQAA